MGAPCISCMAPSFFRHLQVKGKPHDAIACVVGLVFPVCVWRWGNRRLPSCACPATYLDCRDEITMPGKLCIRALDCAWALVLGWALAVT
jgi:hypothetical protein